MAVEVIEATDLLPKDSHGTSNPFVEIHFNNESQRSQTRHNTLSPTWSETFFFSLSDSSLLANSTITASVFHEPTKGRRQFMGHVIISGSSLGPAISSSIQWFPLEKQFFFSRVRGDLCLRAYYLNEEDELINNTSKKKEQEKSTNDTEHVKTKKQGNVLKKKKKKRSSNIRFSLIFCLTKSKSNYNQQIQRYVLSKLSRLVVTRKRQLRHHQGKVVRQQRLSQTTI